MAFLTELEVVNQCLKTMGEAPLNSLDNEHPLVASARLSIKTMNMREQAKGWWFNKELTTLVPEAISGWIILPSDCIRVDPTNETLHYVQRGTKLYQPYATAATDKFRFTQTVECWLVSLVAFDDLPPSAQALVSVAAIRDFQKSYDSDRVEAEALREEYKMAYVQLNAEHIRNVNANVLRRPSLQRVLGMIAPRRAYPYNII